MDTYPLLSDREIKYNLTKEIVCDDLVSFVKLVHPGRLVGSVHSELAQWINRDEAKPFQVVLLPRDHGKSAWAGYWCAQQVIKNPAIRIMYMSATSTLAQKQLKFIKDILTSPVVRFYWPELINIDEGKREKWSETEIAVDHPKRKAEYIRDATVFTAGLTTTITGLHCDIQILDDVVVRENSDTQENRDKVSSQYSLLASIAGAKPRQLVVGTRYHPQDLYGELIAKTVRRYTPDGDFIKEEQLYEKFERQVESVGDGSGEYLWPRQKRYDGVEFGFDQNILAEKKSQFTDLAMFYSQYYNNPNNIESGGINPECFQYYDKSYLKQEMGNWYFKDRRLNLTASIDFAYSLRNTADYTAIVVTGVDGQGNYYVLDIDRFKSNKIPEYYEHIWTLYKKWEFRTLIAEVTAAQEIIVEDIKSNYIYRDGLSLSVKHFRPNRQMGAKEERMEAILHPKYNNRQVWHYKGGNCQILEEELIQRFSPHDDIKDSLATAISFSKPPTSFGKRLNQLKDQLGYHTRFGGLG